MKKEIARIILEDRYSIQDFYNDQPVVGLSCNGRADQILSRIRQRIEGIENPYKNNPIGGGLFGRGFEKCKQKILKELGC